MISSNSHFGSLYNIDDLKGIKKAPKNIQLVSFGILHILIQK